MKKVLLVLAVGLLVAADKPSDEAKKDMKKLEGTWQLVSQVKDGKEATADEAKNVTAIIDAAGNWKVDIGGQVILSGTLKLDPSKSPKAADWQVTVDGKAQGKPALAIYEVDSDSFKHCYSQADRPTKFESKEGSGVTYAVFKRVKK